jgi:hypothetical protein
MVLKSAATGGRMIIRRFNGKLEAELRSTLNSSGDFLQIP